MPIQNNMPISQALTRAAQIKTVTTRAKKKKGLPHINHVQDPIQNQEGPFQKRYIHGKMRGRKEQKPH